MLALSLIIVGILLRFAPHAPNFTPVAAIALFGGTYLKKKEALIVPLALMTLSDVILGLHNTIIFTWGSFILITVLGYLMKAKPSAGRVAIMSAISSLLFYLITNFGVWLMGWYPHTLKGLIDCYIMGLPFLRDFTLATLIYAALFFAAFELVERRVRNTRLARVLL